VTLLKLKTISKKLWLWAKKFWWVIVVALLFLCACLIGALTRNGTLLAGVLDLMDAKKDQHDQEMETLMSIHETEVAEKNKRLREHLRRKAEIEEEFEKRGETLDRKKEAELKRLVDESYNDPEKLAKELAEAFGLK
jgi:flagellar biosynthesis/type III secretory pathway M-ring protein FliF/YscJ